MKRLCVEIGNNYDSKGCCLHVRVSEKDTMMILTENIVASDYRWYKLSPCSFTKTTELRLVEWKLGPRPSSISRKVKWTSRDQRVGVVLTDKTGMDLGIICSASHLASSFCHSAALLSVVRTAISFSWATSTFTMLATAANCLSEMSTAIPFCDHVTIATDDAWESVMADFRR